MNDANSLSAGIALFTVLIGFGVFAAIIWAYARIIAKAGYSPWLVLLMLVPLANIVLVFVFAFSEWPIEQRLRAANTGH